MNVVCIAGARPNFMKIAPLIRAFRTRPEIQSVLVHTGQHYDDRMSKFFFRDLDIPEPDINLGVGSGSHGEQTGNIMVAFEKLLQDEMEFLPDMIVLVGDVNSTIACALVGSKLGVRIAHVEAGLRSYDRRMPEEINRVLTDQISDYLFTTCRDAKENLLREGIPEKNIYFVGNVMIDSLLSYKEKASQSEILRTLDLADGEFIVLTLHRPSNVDQRDIFEQILGALERIQQRVKIVFPVHPRTQKNIDALNLTERVQTMRNLLMIQPLGYLDFLRLLCGAKFVMTDSGGIQEETTVLGIPCLTLRENTERPVTVTEGTNVVVGCNEERIVREAEGVLDGRGKTGRVPALWDGKAAERIAKIIAEHKGVQ